MASAVEVWSLIKKKKEQLSKKDAELKELHQEIGNEIKKPQSERDAGKLASWQAAQSLFREQWKDLHTELDNFQKQHALLTLGIWLLVSACFGVLRNFT